MKAKSCYGMEECPQIVTVQSKTRCPFCNALPYGQPEKLMKKGEQAVYIAVNAGPTGRVFLCMEHAAKLGEELRELLR